MLIDAANYIAFRYRGVIIYNVARNGYADEGVRDYWYSTNKYGSEDDAECFDLRELDPRGNDDTLHQEILRDLIDELAVKHKDARLAQFGEPGEPMTFEAAQKGDLLSRDELLAQLRTTLNEDIAPLASEAVLDSIVEGWEALRPAKLADIAAQILEMEVTVADRKRFLVRETYWGTAPPVITPQTVESPDEFTPVFGINDQAT